MKPKTVHKSGVLLASLGILTGFCAAMSMDAGAPFDILLAQVVAAFACLATGAILIAVANGLKIQQDFDETTRKIKEMDDET